MQWVPATGQARFKNLIAANKARGMSALMDFVSLYSSNSGTFPSEISV